MTKAEIAEIISREIDVSKKDVAFIIDSFFEKVKMSLKKGKTLELRGFGTFGFKIRKSRSARNPRTSEEVYVLEHLISYFKPGKELREITASVSMDFIKDDIERKKRKK